MATKARDRLEPHPTHQPREVHALLVRDADVEQVERRQVGQRGEDLDGEARRLDVAQIESPQLGEGGKVGQTGRREAARVERERREARERSQRAEPRV